ncbi:lichenan permease iic component (pts system lichenan-specific eiiccomponent) (eiic-lic) [Streptococcus pneumoniae]|nr:lichenan permease iic component (pts system lichenan-specific eiiccomponent) (eiic-lic) [Streptococcus pneumoniae]
MVIASFPIPGWEKYLGDIGVADYLWKGVDSSFGLLGLVASFGIAYFMAKQ